MSDARQGIQPRTGASGWGRWRLPLVVTLVVAAALRVWCAAGVPVRGDEVGVAVLQASGQAVAYGERLSRGITPLHEVQALIAYDPAFSLRDVFRSLREAGMHPPLYHILLHYLLRIAGSDAETLRMFSILMSLGAVAAMYGLGRAVWDEAAGRWAAAVWAVAAYGVAYGSLVQPYPLAMLLALVSTFLSVRLASRPPGARAPEYLLYLLVSLAGLYTTYQYVFVLGCQVVYLGLVYRRQPRTLGVLLAGLVSVAVAYAPWLPSLRLHVADVTSRRYYFHQDLDVWRLATEVVVESLTGSAWSRPWLAFMTIGVLFYAALLGGMVTLARNRATRPLVVAIGAYAVLYMGVERWFGISTLTEPKFLFFAVPVSFLVATVGLLRLCGHPRRASLVMWCMAAVLAIGSIIMCATREDRAADTEEVYVRDFAPVLNRTNGGTLLVMNTMQRRYVLPLVHALRGDVDVYVPPNGNSHFLMPNEEIQGVYRRLFVANFSVDYEPDTFLSADKITVLAETLHRQRFVFVDAVESGRTGPRHSLLVFARD